MFDKETWIRLPRTVLVGHGVLGETAAAVGELHLSGLPLVVTSPTAAAVAGETVVDELSTLGPTPRTMVVEESSFDALEGVIETAREVDVGYVVGVGGGKAIDLAKMAADDCDLGFLSVPTATRATASPPSHPWPSWPTRTSSRRPPGS